jgi:thiamine biosynthesis lipoprotein
MRHHPVAVRFACAILAAAAACLSGACAAALPAAALPAGCQDLTPDRPAGSAHHLRGARQLMGTSFQVRVVTPDLAGGCAAIEAAFAEVAREEALFSEYQPASEISAVNRAAGVAPIKVDAEVFGVLQRSLWASRVTGGAFDMTFAGCGALWSVRAQRIPDSESLAACMPRVGFRKVRLDERESSAFLPEPGMRIGLGGIAKGYGVDRATDLLLARGFTNIVVDGGGDLRVEGSDVDGPWTVNIAHPRQPDAVFETIRVGRGAVVTSGDYLRYFERDGVRYHHIIDPSTGWPASRSMAVTVIAPTATDADALATGLFVLGPERGLAAIAGLPGVEALFFAPDLTVHASAGFPRGTRPAGPDHSHE